MSASWKRRGLVVGSTDSAIGRQVSAWMASRLDPANMWPFQPWEVAETVTNGDFDLVVWLLEHPDIIACSAWLRFVASCPITRHLVAVDWWCDSLLRNRPDWPVAVIVRPDALHARLDREWTALTGECDLPLLPFTSDRNERFLFDQKGLNPALARLDGWGHVDSPDRELAASLRDALRESGYRTTTDDETAPALVLFDLDPWPTRRARLLDLMTQWPNARAIGLAGWPGQSFDGLPPGVEIRAKLAMRPTIVNDV